MSTWILIQGIPPELFGINLKRWEKEKETIVWSERSLPKSRLKEAEKYGAILVKEEGENVIIRDPSHKEDTAIQIFENTPSRIKVKEELLKSFLDAFPFTMNDIGSYRTYYSKRYIEKFSGVAVRKKKGKRILKKITKIETIGNQKIIFLVSLRNPLEGILNIAYDRTGKGIYKFKKAIFSYKYEDLALTTDVPTKFGLPEIFKIDEEKINKKLYEE